MANKSTQLAVLGGGPGGYAAAFMAADLGLDVTMVNLEENPGGVCLYRGCIPSKALLHVAKVITESREASEWGITFDEPEIDLDKLRSWKNDVVSQMTGGLKTLSGQRKITYIQGRGQFTGPNSMSIETDDGEKTLEFEHAILATGSVPVEIPGLSLDDERVMDSTGALELPELPGKMLVIGGGYIGLELGQVYSALGSEVSVVEMMSNLLPGADQDLVKHVANRVKSQFVDVMTDSKVTEMKAQKNGIKVTIEDKDGGQQNKIYDRVLMSIGRKTVTDGLGLENTAIEIDDNGFVVTDEQCRTAEDSIFAIGDIAGEPMLAHKASHEGIVAAEVISGEKAAFEPYAIPAVVFTDPELAWAGLTESQAKKEDIDYELARFPWAASGRATTLGRSDGMTKLLIDPETERILGMGIVGPGAGELIAEGVLAIEMAATAEDLKMSIHPHPTLSETVMESAEVFFGHSTHIYRPKRK
ncbi:MAG: dihydrolipoyl dehydrogenase [Candidatus Marinimicrobia bacterium]|nr:dihydrolipoyl dehydrogenase [Candidatus Neomarinimicrobiota bacterium]MCF7828070.1 dihydrolipoyl dehydrogenase [Candidatus Neomarinimicrobiota bacterium]MCF7879755.1 dihydrolipoyl dehydrogenase [Candidatus Neomarinimicrobiota bacterium]